MLMRLGQQFKGNFSDRKSNVSLHHSLHKCPGSIMGGGHTSEIDAQKPKLVWLCLFMGVIKGFSGPVFMFKSNLFVIVFRSIHSEYSEWSKWGETRRPFLPTIIEFVENLQVLITEISHSTMACGREFWKNKIKIIGWLLTLMAWRVFMFNKSLVAWLFYLCGRPNF